MTITDEKRREILDVLSEAGHADKLPIALAAVEAGGSFSVKRECLGCWIFWIDSSDNHIHRYPHPRCPVHGDGKAEFSTTIPATELVVPQGRYHMTNQIDLLTAQRWDNHRSTDSDPISDLRIAVERLYETTGELPTSIEIPRHAWYALQSHPVAREIFGASPRIVPVLEQAFVLPPGTFRITKGAGDVVIENAGGEERLRDVIEERIIPARIEDAEIRNVVEDR